MSEKLGPRTFGSPQQMVFLGRDISENRDYGNKVAQDIDEEVHSLVEFAYETATKILETHNDKLAALAEFLITNETVERDDIWRIFGDVEGIGPNATEKSPIPSPA